MHELIKFTAAYGIMLPLLLTAYVFISGGDKRQRLELLALLLTGGLISLALAKLGSYLIHDPRPFVVGHFQPLIAHANDNGFPSDHTLLASFLGYTLLRTRRWAGVLALMAAAAVGLARVAAGVHHLEDIVGSFIIAGLGTLLALQLVRLVIQRHQAARPTR